MGVFFSFSLRNLTFLSRSSKFGPYVGIPRLERWERAQALGLNPPEEVLIFTFSLRVILKVLSYSRSMTF